MTVDDLLAQFAPEPRYVPGPVASAASLDLTVREPQPDDCLCGHEPHPGLCWRGLCGCQRYRRRTDGGHAAASRG